MKSVWLSFAGEKFLGVAIVPARGNKLSRNALRSAIRKTHELGINPGGEVLAVALSAAQTPPPEYLNRLLNREEANEASKYART